MDHSSGDRTESEPAGLDKFFMALIAFCARLFIVRTV
jgi:hypothetical protein